jgi:hypothetical protein
MNNLLQYYGHRTEFHIFYKVLWIYFIPNSIRVINVHPGKEKMDEIEATHVALMETCFKTCNCYVRQRMCDAVLDIHKRLTKAEDMARDEADRAVYTKEWIKCTEDLLKEGWQDDCGYFKPPFALTKLFITRLIVTVALAYREKFNSTYEYVHATWESEDDYYIDCEYCDVGDGRRLRWSKSISRQVMCEHDLENCSQDELWGVAFLFDPNVLGDKTREITMATYARILKLSPENPDRRIKAAEVMIGVCLKELFKQKTKLSDLDTLCLDEEPDSEEKEDLRNGLSCLEANYRED